jgi:Immunity protein 22
LTCETTARLLESGRKNLPLAPQLGSQFGFAGEIGGDGRGFAAMKGDQMMEEDKRIDGAVSFWVGFSPSRDVLQEYAEPDYSVNDGLHVSKLARDFGTGWYDHDFMDTIFRAWSTRSLPDLLHGCSQGSLIIPTFVALCGEFLPAVANSAVLLYDFKHAGPAGVGSDPLSPVRLQYMGSIQVELPWPD